MVRIEISTDIIGLFGGVSILIKAYAKPIKDGLIDGVEIIGLKRNVPKILSELTAAGLFPLCIHGRTGFNPKDRRLSPFSTLKMIGAKLLITDTQKLMDLNTSLDVLVHNTELEDKNVLGTVLKNNKPGKKIFWVENHPGNGNLGKTIRIVRELRKYGVNAGIIFDLAHELGEKRLAGTQLKIKWDASLKAIEDLRNLKWTGKDDKVPVGFHLAQGLLTTDSMPMDLLSDDQLKNCADVIRSINPERIVFEYQIGVFSAIWPTNQTIKKSSIRIGKLFERWKKAGLFLNNPGKNT